jgi:hypothetical protein
MQKERINNGGGRWLVGGVKSPEVQCWISWQCHPVAMRNKHTITTVKKLFKQEGCRLLEDQYHNNKTLMRYQCRCGSEAYIALQDFLHGVRCGCGHITEGARRRHSLEYVKRFFADHSCELLEGCYQGNHTPLRFRCQCGNIGRVCFSDFQNGIRCGCRRHLGLHRKWTEDRIVTELRKVIAEHGCFPASNQLRLMNRRGLDSAIQSLGGFNYFRHLLHHDRATKPMGYWKNWENVERELRAEFDKMIARGLCPNSRMIVEMGIPSTIITTFGGMSGISERLKCALSSCWKTRDGHVVFSFFEFILDEYLYSIGLPHKPNTFISEKHKYRCDQKVDDYYFEVFGYSKSDKSSRSDAYNQKRIIKERLYKRLGLKPVPIEKEIFQKPYSEIEMYLDEIFNNLGFAIAKKESFDICSLAQQAGLFLTEDEIIKQLTRIIYQIGVFPTQARLHQLGRGDLLMQISKTGGLNHYREKLGYSLLIKPNGYWTFERTVQVITIQYTQLGRLPRQKEMDSGLAHAVQAHGGINRFADMLGLTSVKKPDGWWKDKKVIRRMLEKEVISVLGHFPTAQDLQRMGRYDLLNAIARSGGFKKFRAARKKAL